jgi:predicted dehydrogenase
MSKRNGQGTGVVNVGILGAGGIATKMADTLNLMVGDERYSELVKPYAVATSNSKERADGFAKKYGIPVAYGSYQELFDDPDVDLSYIATPHALHADQAIAAMRAGKNVLIEKSFTGNAAQAKAVLDVSKQTGMLCAEAIWTRYMPSRQMILDTIDSGIIGAPHAITANLAYPVKAKARMTDPAMAGGALLDLGVYAINFIDMFNPGSAITRIDTSCSFAQEAHVDEQLASTLWYDNGVMGSMTASMVCVGDKRGIIWGDKGFIVVEDINDPAKIDVYADYKIVDSQIPPKQLTGFEYQVASCAHAILDGKIEVPEMPHADILKIMGHMDTMRRTWGEVFPFDDPDFLEQSR